MGTWEEGRQLTRTAPTTTQTMIFTTPTVRMIATTGSGSFLITGIRPWYKEALSAKVFFSSGLSDAEQSSATKLESMVIVKM